MLETGEDLEKTLVTVAPDEIEGYARQLQEALTAAK
jgi:hypothetical protein